MKIVRKRTHSINNLEFKSANESITVKLTSENGPELSLENNTVVVFTDSSAYYNLLTDRCIVGDEIDLDTLKIMSNRVIQDDVSMVKYEDKKIYHVTIYNIYISDVYRFDRTV